LQFRFDVLGGNPRLISGSPKLAAANEINSKITKVVQDSVNEFFGEISEENMSWVINTVVKCLTVGDPDNAKGRLTKSLFQQIIRDQKRTIGTFETPSAESPYTWVFASTFASLLAHELQKSQHTTIVGHLESIFGKSGWGNASEYFFHKEMMNSRSSWLATNETNQIHEFDLSGFKCKRIRSVYDIRTAKEKEYLYPTIVNFPVIDSMVLVGDTVYLFQSTIGQSHDVVDEWETIKKICQELGPNIQFKFIWVLEEENFLGFPFHTRLINENISQYKMLNKLYAREAFEIFLNLGKKVSEYSYC
jgi:hypothetical protein